MDTSLFTLKQSMHNALFIHPWTAGWYIIYTNAVFHLLNYTTCFPHVSCIHACLNDIMPVHFNFEPSLDIINEHIRQIIKLQLTCVYYNVIAKKSVAAVQKLQQ